MDIFVSKIRGQEGETRLRIDPLAVQSEHTAGDEGMTKIGTRAPSLSRRVLVTFIPPLLPRMLMNPRTVCFSAPPVGRKNRNSALRNDVSGVLTTGALTTGPETIDDLGTRRTIRISHDGQKALVLGRDRGHAGARDGCQHDRFQPGKCGPI